MRPSLAWATSRRSATAGRRFGSARRVSRTAVAAGYLLGILVASAYAPSFGALGAELFPTSARATAAGWLVAAGVVGAVAGLLAFGLLTDALGSFATAAVLVCAPVVVASLLFARLPETRGLELEQSAPD